MPEAFKLGPVLVGAEDSRGRTLPDPWRLALLRDYLNSPERVAVALTCKSALQLLLQDWGQATLTLPIRPSATERRKQALKRLQAARAQLALRGSQPSTLSLRQRGRLTKKDQWWFRVFSTVGTGYAPPYLALCLHFQFMPPQLFKQPYLSTLTTLTLGTLYDSGSHVQLPPPASLPALRHLTVNRVAPGAQTALWASVGPYMRQLVSLNASEQPWDSRDFSYPGAVHGAAAWVSLFSPNTTTHTLTHLSLDIRLEPWLCKLLMQHTPVLQQLTVSEFSSLEHSADEVGPVCSWRTLRFSDQSYFQPQAWTWVPLPAAGNLTISLAAGSGTSLWDCAIQISLDDLNTVAEKLPRIHFQGHTRVSLSTRGLGDAYNDPIVETDQPHALHNALSLITHLQTQGIELVLSDFTMSDALAAEVSAAHVAGWDRISFDDTVWHPTTRVSKPLPPLHTLDLSEPLGKELLASLCACVSKADTVRVTELMLTSEVHEVLPWRITEVTDRWADPDEQLTSWLHQAKLMGTDNTLWALRELEIAVNANQVSWDWDRQLTQQLTRVTNLHSVGSVCVCMGEDVHVSQQHNRLRASIGILAALPCVPREVTLRGWTATRGVIAELTRLPYWACALTLELTSYKDIICEGMRWPLAEAPLCIPHTYTTWRIDTHEGQDPLPAAEVEAFVLSAPRDRTADKPLTIDLGYDHGGMVARMRERLDEMGVVHVTVTGFH